MGYAIVTRYHGPTNYRGSRVIATYPLPTMPESGERRTASVTVSWQFGISNGTGESETDANHRRAAREAVDRLRAHGWNVSLAGPGYSLPGDDGMVWPLAYGVDR
jgi:hypothetical protein